MILRLTLTTAELAGENPAEWETLKKLVQIGQWTSGPRNDEWRLRGLATRLKVPLREEGYARLRRRSPARARRPAGTD